MKKSIYLIASLIVIIGAVFYLLNTIENKRKEELRKKEIIRLEAERQQRLNKAAEKSHKEDSAVLVNLTKFL